MNFIFEARLTDSPFVQTVWRTQSESDGTFTSPVESHREMVVTKQKDNVYFMVCGPETKASPGPVPQEAEFFGIVFKIGTFMPDLSPCDLVDSEVRLPEARGHSFWLHGSVWQPPNYENADVFVDRLVRAGLLVRDPLVDAALQGHRQGLSLRSVQRRFLGATGAIQSTWYQIERGRRAMMLLQQDVSILDTVDRLDYADQPHFARSLKRFIGQMPAQVVRENQSR